MKFKKVAVFILSALSIASCRVVPAIPFVNNGELTGIWRSELNNTIYSINQKGSSVKINVCNNQAPFSLVKNGSNIGGLLIVNNSSQLQFLSGSALAGVKLNKISNSKEFNSGSLLIKSNQMSNLDLNAKVCAYRESDEMYNIISAPYLDGYLSLKLGVLRKSSGEYSIPADISIDIESDKLVGGNINAISGVGNVINYSKDKLEARFTFVGADGFDYSGIIDVKI